MSHSACACTNGADLSVNNVARPVTRLAAGAPFPTPRAIALTNLAGSSRSTKAMTPPHHREMHGPLPRRAKECQATSILTTPPTLRSRSSTT